MFSLIGMGVTAYWIARGLYRWARAIFRDARDGYLKEAAKRKA